MKTVWPTRSPAPHRHGGFSLLELMIAIVILGLGLVMVATTYPLGWQRARRLSEYTRQLAVTETAHMTVKMLAKVDGNKPGDDAGSFAGDLVYDNTSNRILFVPDNRVHMLYVENALVEAPRAFYPDRISAKNNDEWSPWELERTDLWLGLNRPNLPDRFFETGFGAAQVRFESRLYPALPARQGVTAEGEFENDDPHWDEAYESIRFAWCAFSKLVDPDRKAIEAIIDKFANTGDTSDYLKAVEGKRTFQMYYVTLRRGRPGSRYARQDIDPEKLPDPLDRALEVEPAALPADQDVLIPSPWRLQVRFPDELAWRDDLTKPEQPTGIPTEIEVARGPSDTATWLVDMFQDGAQLIDEVNGLIYTITRSRLSGVNLDQAFLTLDREYFVEDLDDDNITGFLEPEETLRTIWLFPPPVEAARLEGEIPAFVGSQPVVSIEKRLLTISPK